MNRSLGCRIAADREKGPHLRGAKRPIWKRERTKCDALEAPGDGIVTRNSAPAVGRGPGRVRYGT